VRSVIQAYRSGHPAVRGSTGSRAHKSPLACGRKTGGIVTQEARSTSATDVGRPEDHRHRSVPPMTRRKWVPAVR